MSGVTPFGNGALERHYTVQQIAEMWGLHQTTVRRIFQDEPGVFRLGKTGRRDKRDYVTLRIPESVLLQVYERRSRALAFGATRRSS